MAAKMFALFALLALCASATSATHIPGHLPLVMPLGTMNPCTQYCMMQQRFARLLAWPIPMLQQLSLQPAYQTPMTMPNMMPPMTMMPSMMSLPQCHCDAISQIMQQQQLPFMFNPTAMAIPPMFLQQPFVSSAF
uniref:Delta-kafirin n=1 Tax=Sorghum bicolor TaxID=4558 RepID=Q93X70_SORBI|nr:seed storage protein delta kafirin [Sorghum bicolor]AEO14403.1 delta-kafirin precursor [Sorghum bicolor]AEO14408.1 delta-kafirin precursor [Sorghum bicolor]AEO14409.1 delta-kafirin precursor [Sorghum bicolor]AEO14411.1 delta-kafirin precursor [Sorghum bicolor]